MKAAVLTGKRQITVKEVPNPQIGPGELLAKVEYAGICGSDVHAYQDLIFPVGTILGHEFAGTIVDPGDGSHGLRKGQRIVARPAGMCGKCEWCHRGELGLCKNHWSNTLGLQIPGGFAEYVKMKSYMAIPLPDSISFQEAAQLEPVAVTYHAVDRVPLHVGEPVVLFGAGPIGLLVLQFLRASGVRPTYVIEKSPMRRKKAEEFGAEFVFAPSSDLPDKIRQKEKGGINTVFDCVGYEETMQQSLDIVKTGGTVVMIGVSAKPISLNQLRWIQKGITVVATLGYFVDHFAGGIRALDKKLVRVDNLVSHVFSLDEIEKGMQLLENPDQALKVLIRP